MPSHWDIMSHLNKSFPMTFLIPATESFLFLSECRNSLYTICPWSMKSVDIPAWCQDVPNDHQFLWLGQRQSIESSSQDCSSGKSSMECNMGTCRASCKVPTGSSSLSAGSDNLVSPLSRAHISHVPNSHECTPTCCLTNLLNQGQSMSKIWGQTRR